MARTTGRDNPHEVELRRLLHARGLRFRVHYPVPELPRRTIDVAFPAARVAVFLDGCFWHGCPEHRSWPKANEQWWRTKLERNRTRDAETTGHLEAHGWRVLRFWEHESVEMVATAVADELRQAREAAPRSVEPDQ